MADIETRIVNLPLWSGRPELAALVGGLSNQSFTVTDDSGKYVVRVTRDFPFHNVYRDREVASARAAHAAGFAPEIVHAEPGLMISRFIDGRVLTAADIRADIPRIAELVRRFHTEMPTDASANAFDIFAINRFYIRQLQEAGTVPSPNLDAWLDLTDELASAQQPSDTIYGHHDLLPANLIDDGRRLWLIDFEYAGLGVPLFDLANLASNAGFSAEGTTALLAAYFGAPPDAALLRAHGAMEVASLLREVLWSHVSAIHMSAPGADYAAYARDNLMRVETALAGWRTRFNN